MKAFALTFAAQNCKKRPLRTLGLVLLVAFLSFTMFGGAVLISGLRNGLDSYEARLGADIVVVPYEARTKGQFEDIILEGIPGSFYMRKSYYDKIVAIEGIEVASPQFYLASTSAGCCSVPVQIIGFDPSTDFIIQPWIRESFAGTVGDMDIVIGADVSMPLDRSLTFYNTTCRVVAQLEKTGTGLDTSVYGNMNTVRQMAKNAVELGFQYKGTNVNTDVSSVMIKVKAGYDVEWVKDQINIYVSHVVAGSSAGMVNSISQGLGNISTLVGALLVVIWVLSIVILVIGFVMIAGERKKEFAVLRALGASQKMLAGYVSVETALLSLVGAALGLVLASVVVFPLGASMRTMLQLPYLLPKAGVVVLMAVGALLAATLVGALASLATTLRIAKNETGLLLREDA